jgi:gliding motility-associated-like protein
VNPGNFDLEDATFSWTVGGQPVAETGSSITGTVFGTYTATVTVNDCTSSVSVDITPDTTVIATAFEDFCEGMAYNLQVNDVEGSFDPSTSTYAWTGPNGFTGTTQAVVITEIGTYNVTVTTADNCIATGSYEVLSTSCLIQRGISPDGDGDNDFFDLSTLDVEQLSIFNRYGQEVYNKSPYSDEWVGQADNGDELPTGTYFYMIRRSNGEEITGWIYINREE